jgi:hypothetical protein
MQQQQRLLEVAAAAAVVLPCSGQHQLHQPALLMLVLLLRLLGWVCLASLMVQAHAAGWGSQQATAGQHQMQQGR